MEILLNDEFYKMEFCGSNKIRFNHLDTFKKILIENWFKDVMENKENMSSDIKIDIPFVWDSRLGILKGVFPCQVGDSSEQFQLSYDNLDFRITLFPSYVKHMTGQDNTKAGIIPNFG